MTKLSDMVREAASAPVQLKWNTPFDEDVYLEQLPDKGDVGVAVHALAKKYAKGEVLSKAVSKGTKVLYDTMAKGTGKSWNHVVTLVVDSLEKSLGVPKEKLAAALNKNSAFNKLKRAMATAFAKAISAYYFTKNPLVQALVEIDEVLVESYWDLGQGMFTLDLSEMSSEVVAAAKAYAQELGLTIKGSKLFGPVPSLKSVKQLDLVEVNKALDEFHATPQTAPQIAAAMTKFGARRVRDYLWALEAWLDSSDKSKANVDKLANGVDIFDFLVPRPSVPTWLYRGLSDLNKIPAVGQTVRYTTKRPGTGWSLSPKIANGFCDKYGDTGLLLKVSGTKLLKHGMLLFWPNANKELNKFVTNFFKSHEKEWGIKLTKKMIVDDWSYCDPKFPAPSPKKKFYEL